MKKKKASIGKTVLKENLKKKKRTRRANTKDIVKADKVAARLRLQADKDIAEISEHCFKDDFRYLDYDDNDYVPTLY